jgi:hypothetical protein
MLTPRFVFEIGSFRGSAMLDVARARGECVVGVTRSPNKVDYNRPLEPIRSFCARVSHERRGPSIVIRSFSTSSPFGAMSRWESAPLFCCNEWPSTLRGCIIRRRAGLIVAGGDQGWAAAPVPISMHGGHRAGPRRLKTTLHSRLNPKRFFCATFVITTITRRSTPAAFRKTIFR